ncbi:dihydrofolate reductase [Mesoplasma florum]|uniref:dihydrofolate reductase n=1 Tax=Mesoplasma florum TaxID=2151 RepID=UPI000BE37A9B|nr:dihydrofolate reductase [Mesoplasma florum]ATI73345.1 dihydrofolate reductase [Mesoplasma florum]AVN61058.1 dihydrofolate reductase [Mesoplasma florum]AVN61746.1 dihydrofolate reductase [Mesoplasma florum]
MIKMIWAQTDKGVIGKDNSLPWSIKEEMQHFRTTTLNQNVLMGGKTFESMNFKGLPNRINYVLTRDTEKYKEHMSENVNFINKKDFILKEFKGNTSKDIYIIGGSQIYELFFDDCDEIIRSIIKDDFEGNVHIKNFNYDNFDKINIVEKEHFYVEYMNRRK